MAKNERLKEAVEEIKFRFKLKTQKDVCSKMGYTSSTYLSDMIGGKNPISESFIERLSEVFGVNKGYFSDDEEVLFLDESVTTSNNQIGENITYQHGVINQNILDKALDEISEMRKLLAESIRNNKEQADRFFNIIERIK